MLHGANNELREHLVGVLLETKGPKLAARFALCGYGDTIKRRGKETFLAPKGCGHKLCPRCSRKRGGAHARRILEWLAWEPHGDLWVMCLTQKVIPGESLAAARKRMAPKQRAYLLWLKGLGMTAAMTTCHRKRSTRVEGGGWHYHVHLFIETPPGLVSKLLLLWKWADIDPWHRVDYFKDQARQVLAAGGAIVELRKDSGDVDMWHESTCAVARAVQYPVRDMAQGVTLGLLGGELEEAKACARELAVTTNGWKMFTSWGRWRKKCPAAAEPEEKVDEDTGEVTGGAAPGQDLGPVFRLWRRARKGDAEAREAFRELEAGCRNQSDFARRFVRFCRWAWDPGGSG